MTEKPKIALYLAGHMRGYCGFVRQSIQFFIDGHDVDIFVATHNYQDHTVHKQADGTNYTGSDVQVTENVIREKLVGLPVKKILICNDRVDLLCSKCRTNIANYATPRKGFPQPEPYIPTHCDICKDNDMIEYADHSCIGMWRNVWRCHTMAKECEREHGFKYKYYIRSRPDLVYLEKLDFDRLPPLNQAIITGFGGTLGYPDDQFAIGEEEAMNAYCDLNKVLENWLVHHQVVKHTIEKYPIIGHINTGLVRLRHHPEPNKIIQQVDVDKWLMFYSRKQFKVSGVPYET